MNNDQQNANLRPPVSQTMPTMQPMPDQSPQVTPTAQPLPSQSPQMANQQLAVEPEAEAVTNPNDAPKGIIQQHREFVNSSNNIVFHLARSTTITLIVFFVGAFLMFIARMQDEPFFGPVIVNLFLVPFCLTLGTAHSPLARLRLWRIVSSIMLMLNVGMLFMHGLFGIAKDNDPSPAVGSMPLWMLPAEKSLITVLAYMIFIIPPAIIFLVTTLKYSKATQLK
ncbi:hypothetical protein HG438_000340 [Candidatus Saccharibacteria bacterium]|nr:hypothetical protein [Candidatus Saccharibacteria bacterium]